ncbi:N-acetylglucosamine-6-phosphate deacetylase [Pararhodobacter sp.]|uniref:N-acetylglucosamine-6-phosphate deacetylase n=1 Tax=Pararhodobacter sp. TaxID=2127056 RepID=UPI002AFEEF37|nr:N-acetylglucosamine-6-phosphate deacetylase [Pararhodobacter sp.]
MRRMWRAAQIFDGQTLHRNRALLTDGGVVVDLIDAALVPTDCAENDLGEGILCPGFVDLQVNGGGGALLGLGDPYESIVALCAAHGRLGTLALLPTLITSDTATFHAVLDAGRRALRDQVPGFAGLHLEGPFLDPRRKGAHDPALIRRMTDRDLAALIEAARDLPAVMVTLAPENASLDQIAALAAAGIVVSLGHTDTDEATARKAIAAGATCATHLYNAMSPLSHRAPGLVGTALDAPIWAGIIPDGVHVSPTAFRVAMRAKPGRVFAVSDAMSVAGTDTTEFTLNGRTILRRDGRLTLADGTLAGADISLPQALKWMVETVGVPLAEALAMMTAIPGQILEQPLRGTLAPGAPADLVHLGEGFSVQGVWRGAEPVR